MITCALYHVNGLCHHHLRYGTECVEEECPIILAATRIRLAKRMEVKESNFSAGRRSSVSEPGSNLKRRND
jgi:hypothetical protein